MKKIHFIPLFIIIFLLSNSSLQIINLEFQDTNVNDGLSSLKTGDQSENNVFLEKLKFNEFKDKSQYIIEEIESGEDDEDDEDEEDEEDEKDEEDDEDGDGIGDESENLNERSIEVDYSENEAQIESKLRQGDVKDKIAVKMQIEDEGLKIEIEYSKDDKNS